jgi:hypothetical protein
MPFLNHVRERPWLGFGKSGQYHGSTSPGVGHLKRVMKSKADTTRRDVKLKMASNVETLINTPAIIGKTADVKLRAPLIPA